MSNPLLRLLLSLCLAASCASALVAETIAFDGLRSNDNADYSVGQVQGFNFPGFLSHNYGASGAYILIETANYEDYAGFSQVSGDPFALNSLVIAPGNGNSLPDEIWGYRNGTLVDSAPISEENSSNVLTLNWSNIDAVLFPNAFDADLIPSYDAIYSITVNDPIVPEPASLVLAFIGGVLCLGATYAKAQRHISPVPCGHDTPSVP